MRVLPLDPVDRRVLPRTRTARHTDSAPAATPPRLMLHGAPRGPAPVLRTGERRPAGEAEARALAADLEGAVAGQVGGEHEGVVVGRVGEHPCPAGAGAVLVLLEAAVDVRFVDPDRAVQQIAGEDRPVAPGLQVDDRGTRGVPGRRFEPEAGVDDVGVLPGRDEPRVDHRLDAVLVDVLVSPSEPRAVQVVGVPVRDVGPRHRIRRVGEGGHPVASVEAGVPADVVVV
ncbi:hypothetical protein GCM10019016_109550 [Streptomyces prasinosporus]|uniref:Uncharacterized protein n=1 Tax=Streptomyces prasinosporus TaxID=68256 RepID=A0ABP6UAT6_9ACTN